MKLFFDGCKIGNISPDGHITLKLSGPDLAKYFPYLEEIVTKGNPPVDVTLNYSWMQLNRAECQKCKGTTDYLIAMPRRSNYENDVDFMDAQGKVLQAKPTGLKCKKCGVLIE